MKKYLAYLPAFALLLCLGACAGRPQPSPGPTPPAAVTPTPAPEPAPSPAPEPEDPTEPLLGKMKRENAESIRYELGGS